MIHTVIGGGMYSRRNNLRLAKAESSLFIISSRNIVTVANILRSVLKIRYIVLGSAVGGGVHLSKVKSIQMFSKCLTDIFLSRNMKIGRKVCQSLLGLKIIFQINKVMIDSSQE